MTTVDFCQWIQEKYCLCDCFLFYVVLNMQTLENSENTKQDCICHKIFLIKHLLMTNKSLITKTHKTKGAVLGYSFSI